MSERELWRAVIAQAFQDMVAPTNDLRYRRSRAVKVQEEAKTWLTELSDDLVEVCEHADMDPAVVVDAAWDLLIYGRSPFGVLSSLPSLT